MGAWASGTSMYQADVLVDYGAASAVIIPQYCIVIFFNIILKNTSIYEYRGTIFCGTCGWVY
jgi:hypothetical protein